MPTYDYRCDSCNKQFELIHSMKIDKIEMCPLEECEIKKPITKLISPSNISFMNAGKGSYIHDYKIPQDKIKDGMRKINSPKASKIEFD